jgi:hypothetical protein
MRGMIIAGGVLLAALALAPAASYAQADDADASDRQVDPADVPAPPPSWQSATTPRMACGVRPLPYKSAGASTATFTCWVTGAPADNTSFTVRAMRIVDQAGSARPLGVVCDAGALDQGAGVCVGSVTDPTGAPLIGGLLISARLEPSGLELGPVHVSPTLAAGL